MDLLVIGASDPLGREVARQALRAGYGHGVARSGFTPPSPVCGPRREKQVAASRIVTDPWLHEVTPSNLFGPAVPGL